MSHYRECPLCASGEISLHLICKDHFISKENFEIYKCASCGFLFTQDHPDENSMPRYYDSDEYISHSDTSEGLSNKLYRLVRGIMLRRKRVLIQKTSVLRTGSILDIGCGTGYFGGAMKKAGWQVTGIEINEKARSLAASRFGLNVISPVEISVLPDHSFDIITLWHVLEHFHDPFKYFSDISNLLKPGGVCIVALPNSNSYDAKHFKQFWAAYDVPRHLWHFDPSSFNCFLKKVGFRCEMIRNLPFDVFYISILSEKYRGSKIFFLKGIIKGKLFFLLSLFKVKRSSSIIYVLRKFPGQ